MRLGVKWSTSALLGVAAGVGAAFAKARPARRVTLPPRESLGVDGLGEVQSADVGGGPPADAHGVGDAAEVNLAAHPRAVTQDDRSQAAADEAIRALDEARDRLRRRADDLAREMGGSSDS